MTAPPFLHHPEIYNLEFWHAQLNYACTRFATSHGSDRLLGNQICHWTKGTLKRVCRLPTSWFFCRRPLAPTSFLNTLPRCLPLSAQLMVPSTQDDPHTLRIHQSSLLTPPAVISRQAEQIANARRRAAEGSLAPYTNPPPRGYTDTVK